MKKPLTKNEALKRAGYVPVIGRPPVGSAMLDKITVPTELKIALEATAARLGVSVPVVRREAYVKFTNKKQY
jgi:hypothetical protein